MEPAFLCVSLMNELKQTNKKTLKKKKKNHTGRGSLGGSAVEHLPLAQGAILESRDRVPRQAPSLEPASPSACVSASLSLSLMNK